MKKAKDLFPDVGFLLAVLNGLLVADRLDVALIKKTLVGIAEKNYGLDRHEYDLDIEAKRAQEALERLAALKVDEADLAVVERLDFDGGNDIYLIMEEAIDIETGGEENWYCLAAMTGIDKLKQLKQVNLDGYGYRDGDLDLRPLANHPTVEQLTLSGRCTGASTLETLPSLKTLDLQLVNELDDESVVERLQARGVETRR